MQRIIASFVNPPKQDGGKYGSIKATDGRYYSFEWQRYRNEFRKGGTYNVEVEEKQQGNKTFYNITGIGPDDAPRSSGGNGDPPPDRWYMPFVSNTVAHAIEAELITKPADIEVWARAAKQAAQDIDTVDNDDNDDIPF